MVASGSCAESGAGVCATMLAFISYLYFRVTTVVFADIRCENSSSFTPMCYVHFFYEYVYEEG